MIRVDDPRGTSNESRFALIATAVVSVVAHAISLLSRRDFWDGLLYTALSVDRDWAGSALPFRDAGYPLQGMINWYLGLLGPRFVAFGYRFIALLCITVSALVVTDCAQRIAHWSPRRALFLGSLFATSPVFYMGISAINVLALVNLACFALSSWLLLTERSDSRFLAGRRVLAVALAFAGFTWRSFLVFFGIVALLRTYSRVGDECWKKPSVTWAAIRSDLWLYSLPFAYALLNRLLFPQTGNYARDNSFPGISTATRSLAAFLYRVTPTEVAEVLAAPFRAGPVALFVGTFVALGSLAFAARLRKDREEHSLQWQAVCFMGATLLAAIFPYAAVGKVPTVHWEGWFPLLTDWTPRWLILTPLPLAMALVSVSILVTRMLGMGTKAESALLAAALGANVAALDQRYVQWLHAGAVDRAVIEDLARATPFDHLPSEHVCFIERSGRSMGTEHRIYELSVLFREAWGGRARSWLPSNWDDGYSSEDQKQRRPKYFVYVGEVPADATCTFTISSEAAPHSDLGLFRSVIFGTRLANVQISVAQASAAR